VMIKRWVPEYEQDFLWNHTRQIREFRVANHHPGHHHHPQILPNGGVVVVEDNGRERKEDRMEFVRKKRKPSPNPLIAYFAGGSRR